MSCAWFMFMGSARSGSALEVTGCDVVQADKAAISTRRKMRVKFMQIAKLEGG